jgi:DNA-binding transcriptional MerR regulator
MSGRLRIGQVAARAGVSPDTIRYYERIGLLPQPSRTPAGYRQYDETAVERIRLVRNASRFGLTLDEISAFLKVRRAGGLPCRSVLAAGRRILSAVDAQIAALTATRETIRHTLRDWEERMERTPAGEPARLLEVLRDDTGAKLPRALEPRRRREP